jgi:hypothetical protein
LSFESPTGSVCLDVLMRKAGATSERRGGRVDKPQKTKELGPVRRRNRRVFGVGARAAMSADDEIAVSAHRW